MLAVQRCQFTIHFATINTTKKAQVTLNSYLFTIHFATINTGIYVQKLYSCSKFTIHFATINTLPSNNLLKNLFHLQYTLLLLIP